MSKTTLGLYAIEAVIVCVIGLILWWRTLYAVEVLNLDSVPLLAVVGMLGIWGLIAACIDLVFNRLRQGAR
jgi:hypothetical protein